MSSSHIHSTFMYNLCHTQTRFQYFLLVDVVVSFRKNGKQHLALSNFSVRPPWSVSVCAEACHVHIHTIFWCVFWIAYRSMFAGWRSYYVLFFGRPKKASKTHTLMTTTTSKTTATKRTSPTIKLKQTKKKELKQMRASIIRRVINNRRV